MTGGVSEEHVVDEEEPLVVTLSRRQLAAYNERDLAAFAACFHPEVIVLSADGTVVYRGIEAFRVAYGAMFSAHREVKATVAQRMVLGEHVVELEHWSRIHAETGTRTEGTVLVRYTERDGLLAIAEFLRLRA